MSWENIIKRQAINFPAFKQSIIEAAESFPVGTTIDFTRYDEEARKFVERAQEIYSNLTHHHHATRVFRRYGISGRLNAIKSILQNNGWDLEHHKFIILTKVV